MDRQAVLVRCLQEELPKLAAKSGTHQATRGSNGTAKENYGDNALWTPLPSPPPLCCAVAINLVIVRLPVTTTYWPITITVPVSTTSLSGARLSYAASYNTVTPSHFTMLFHRHQHYHCLYGIPWLQGSRNAATTLYCDYRPLAPPSPETIMTTKHLYHCQQFQRLKCTSRSVRILLIII